MKVYFNQTTQINRSIPNIRVHGGDSHNKKAATKPLENCYSEKLQSVSYKNISFKSTPEDFFLLGQTEKLNGIYSGQKLIDPRKASKIYKKLADCPNVDSAVKALQNYTEYMLDVELAIFNIFREAEYKGKKGFQDILASRRSESLDNIKQKQVTILQQTDDVLDVFSRSDAREILNLKEKALLATENGSFDRKALMTDLYSLMTQSSYRNTIELSPIYKLWYKLPRAMSDIDAFILKYKGAEHEVIARKLISPSIATVEHIIPSSNGGQDKLSNKAIEASAINNDKSAMSLLVYMTLHPELPITANIQKYINSIIREINRGNKDFIARNWYPEELQNTISIATESSFIPDMAKLFLSKAQIRQNNYPKKLNTRYRVFHK